MSLYTDPMTVQAEIDRRFELAGVDPSGRHPHDHHRRDLPARPLGAHPLAAFVARLVGRRQGSTSAARPRRTVVPSGLPRHP